MSLYPTIRQAREEDSAELARLATQLGYPASEQEMSERLQRLLANSSHVVFAAEAGPDGLAGWIHGALSQFLESDYRAEIAGLVVDERFQRKGIGRALVARVEAWAAEQGVRQAVVRCRTTRSEAHRFYHSLGYTEAKTQIVFRKPLAPSGRPTQAPAKSSGPAQPLDPKLKGQAPFPPQSV